MLRLLQDVCSSSGELPSKYWIRGISVNWRQYIARGGEAIIYQGTMGEQNVVVREILKPGENSWTSQAGKQVIKVCLILMQRGGGITNNPHKLIKREIIVHSQLQHPNVIPLLGIYRESASDPPMMIMPFMKKGSAPAFLQSVKCTDVDCARIVRIVGYPLLS